MAVSKRLRYEVFRRDNHACRYCGATAPDVKLTIDHVVPKALGGSDTDPANLVTACEPCNAGKTSTNPDAPLVADVAQDALRWAKALTQSAEVMLAEQDRFSEVHDQFDAWWTAWTCGADKSEIPRPPDWKRTVDTFMATGLPLPILKGCLEKAMGTPKVIPAETFRYMCGIAWKKVTELQEGAQAIASGGTPRATTSRLADTSSESGRLNFAQELLEDVSQEERDYFLANADMTGYPDEGEPPQTESQLACSAVTYMLNSVRCEWDYLASKVEEVLRDLPDGIGERAFETHGKVIGAAADPYGRKTIRLTNALWRMADLLSLPAAQAYLDAMPAEQRAEWLEYATALYSRANLSVERQIARAADCARTIDDGQRYSGMCHGPGQHIPICPSRATRYVRFAEFDCCRDSDEAHEEHLLCERHLEWATSGKLRGHGQSLTVLGHKPLLAEEAVPF